MTKIAMVLHELHRAENHLRRDLLAVAERHQAELVCGRTLTSFPSLRTDITNAGGTAVDEQVATDGNLVTSRDPDDLPAFYTAIVELFAAN